jgi:XTP/dITP diphosphohydrolase
MGQACAASEGCAVKELLLGTTNPAKVHIVRASVEALPIQIVTPDDLGLQVEVEEGGRSTAENAERKARVYFAASRMPTLAIDGGLQIEGLPAEKQPGVLIRRIYGPDREATDSEVLDYYQRELEGIGGERTGLWQGSIALVVAEDHIVVDTFRFKTILTSRRKGSVTPGAPLDALTIDPSSGRHYSEMAWKERPDAQWVFAFMKDHLDAW